MVIDIEDAHRLRAIQAAARGDKEPARKMQEALLARLIGQGEGVLDLPIINPRDHVQGLWDSLERATRGYRLLSRDISWPGKTSQPIVHREDAGEQYRVVLVEKKIRVDGKFKHLSGASVNVISFKDGCGNEYLKLFGRRGGDTPETAALLYQRTREGIWRRKDEPETPEEVWAVRSQTLRDFLVAAAVRNIHRNRLTATSYAFYPKPPGRGIGPTPQKNIA